MNDIVEELNNLTVEMVDAIRRIEQDMTENYSGEPDEYQLIEELRAIIKKAESLNVAK